MKTNEEFYAALAEKESGGWVDPYRAYDRNKRYLGKYQLGEGALKDIELYDKANGNYYSHDWTGKFTGKHGVNSKDDFFANHEAQEKAIREYMNKQWNYISDVHDYVGKHLGDIVLTPSGMLAGAHLVGQKRLRDFIKSNGKMEVPKDGNGVPVTVYMKSLGHYDVSPQTNGFKYNHQLAESQQYALDKKAELATEFEKWRDECVNGHMWNNLKKNFKIKN